MIYVARLICSNCRVVKESFGTPIIDLLANISDDHTDAQVETYRGELIKRDAAFIMDPTTVLVARGLIPKY